MLISCPNCETQFAVPESALGPKGRTLKCARCGHKWFQAPPPPEAEPESAAEEEAGGMLPGFENFAFGDAAATEAAAAPPDLPAPAPAPPRSAAEIVDFDLDEAPRREPIPEALKGDSARRGGEPPRRGRGAALLWTVALLLLLVGGGGFAAFVFQERLVALWPGLAEPLRELGLRREVVGAGLAFRNSSSERLVQGEKEVLVVRGIIANVTEEPRDVPSLRLALYDNETLVQDKLVRPPVDGLDPGATSSFRIVLDQPHPMATRFEVTFVDQFAAAK